jgi:hypothetical protein
MHLHLTYLEFLSSAIALVVAGFLVSLTLASRIGRYRRKIPPFLDYLRSDFDRDHPQQDFLTESDDWTAHSRVRVNGYESRGSNLPDRDWDKFRARIR